MKTKKILKAITIRIYPNKKQQEVIAKSFGCSRFVWNQMLNMQQERYKNLGKSAYVSAFGMNYLLTALKVEYPWLTEVDSTSLQYTNETLNEAFKRFFKKNAKYPKFKSRKHEQSYTSKNVNSSCQILDAHTIKLPKLGKVSFKQKKLLDGKIKKVTIRQKASGKYFASILYETEIEILPKTNNAVGIDLGLKDFLIMSDGLKISAVRFDKNLEDKLIYWQKIAAHRLLNAKSVMVKDNTKSLLDFKNYQKARRMAAKYHEMIANQRLDFLHQLSTWIVRNFDKIVLEDLKAKNMMHNHKLARAIANAGWNSFINMLKYKCEWYEKEFIQVSAKYTSQMCSNCGSVNGRLGYDRYGWLKVREWTCPDCGSHHDRDINAAINILNLAV